MYANSEEPLARQAAINAAKRERRKSSLPIGGMASNMPTALDSQAAMDQMQAPDISSPVRKGPIRLASMQSPSGGAEGGAIMNVGYRRSGGTVLPSRAATCAPGSPCALRQSQGLGISNPASMPVSSVPMAGMPVADMSMGVPADASGFIEAGRQALQSADMTGSGADATVGMSYLQTGLNMMQQATADDVTRQYLEQYKKNSENERLTSEHNRAAAKEGTVEGHNEALIKIVGGAGQYKTLDAETRGRQAAEEAARVYNAETTGKPFDFEGAQKFFHAKAAAFDIAGILAGSGAAVKDDNGQVRWRGSEGDGGDMVDAINHLATSAYYKRRDPDTKRILAGDDLKIVMHNELDTPISFALQQRVRAAFPDLDEDAARRVALSEAHRMVERLWHLPNEANMRANDQSGAGGWRGVYDWMNQQLGGGASASGGVRGQATQPVQSVGEDSTRMMD